MTINKKATGKNSEKQHVILSLPISLLFIISFIASTCFAIDYPYRKDYPEINHIEPADLKAGYDSGDFIIVDIRSLTEYEAVHVKAAIHMPYSNLKFVKNLLELSEKNPDKKISVYGNCTGSIDSYKAAEDAMYAGMTNVYAFDAGIVTWARKYPAATLLQDKELTDSENLIISSKMFKKRCLDFETFKQQAAAGNAVVIDTREPIQRTQTLPGLDKALQIPLDKFVRNILRKGNMKDKQLYIFDQVGMQVRWLMYNLTDEGYTDFLFLDGGATAVLEVQEYR